jgi:hypothetical protein
MAAAGCWLLALALVLVLGRWCWQLAAGSVLSAEC